MLRCLGRAFALTTALRTQVQLGPPGGGFLLRDVCTRAGFPPILLTEVNFQAMFEAQQAQMAAQANGGSRIITGAN